MMHSMASRRDGVVGATSGVVEVCITGIDMKAYLAPPPSNTCKS